MFFKKNTIKFYCELPEVKEKYPIFPAKVHKFDWFRQSAKCFKDIIKQKSTHEQLTGVVKCPGVSPIMNKGYIVQSWFDLTIKPLVHPDKFEFFIPQGLFSYLKEKNYNKRLISWFSSEDPAHAIPLAEDQLQSLIKITLPWAVSIPVGWQLLFMPIPYPDNNQFIAVHGVLEPGEYYQINAIIKINQFTDEFTIPAGTPLFQIIPVKTDLPTVEILDYSESIKELELKHKFESNNTFVVKK